MAVRLERCPTCTRLIVHYLPEYRCRCKTAGPGTNEDERAR